MAIRVSGLVFPPRFAPSEVRRGGVLGREISVDCMGYEDAGAKQNQDDRDSFNHFMHPVLHYTAPLVARACFKIVSSG